MQAIILAGGVGTRLRPLTYTIPKPMLPIGGKPAIARLADALAAAGFDEIFITTNYLADVIERGLREYSAHADLPIPVHCLRETQPLGTAGSIKNALHLLHDEFLVIQGDAVAEVDYEKLLNFHRERTADVTITTIRVRDPREFGIVETDESGRILRFQEKPRIEDAFSNQANAGFYLLKKELFDDVPTGEPYDFSKQLFPALMARDKRFFAWELGGYWVDIGRPQSYLEGNRHAIAGRAEIADDVRVPASATLLPPFVIGAGTRLSDGCIIGPGAIIGARCKIGDKARIAGGVLFDDVEVGDGARLDECVIASGSRIGDKADIGALAMVGEDCDIGARAEIAPHSRVGPHVPVAAGTVVEGVLAPAQHRIESWRRDLMPAPEGLSREGKLVFSLLAEFGEMTAYELVRATGMALEAAGDTLDALEAAGWVLSTQDVPRRYALTREMPHAQPAQNQSQSAPSVAPEAPPSESTPTIVSTPHRILFVDDLPDTREIFRLALESRGLAVRLAESGSAALEAVRDEVFDAIILDMMMPEMDGLQTLQKIRALPNGATVPVLIFTALYEGGIQKRAAEAGADGVLLKPMLPQELIERVTALLPVH
jgi:NDP-sugar pyrophosphorylase family protein/CheY-like chemotaxis protein